jgi:hypothetical protein
MIYKGRIKQRRWKREQRLKRLETRLKFYIADRPQDLQRPVWEKRLEMVRKTLQNFEESPYILEHDPFFVDRIQVKILRLEYLSGFYREVNRSHRRGKNFEGIILTKYWREKIQENIGLYGIPFPEKAFWVIRTTLRYYRNRLKK